MKSGKNKGKKYIKLRGGEVATPENKARADKFVQWYGRNCEYIRQRLIFDYLYDDEVATETMLKIYEDIAYKGVDVRDKKFYFLRAYHTNYIAAQKRKGKEVARWEYIEDNSAQYVEVAAPSFDYEQYERVTDALQREILDFVRGKYAPLEVSIFEIYIYLQPEMSYKKLAAMLGIPANKIWPIIGGIKKDVARKFEQRRYYLLSLLD